MIHRISFCGASGTGKSKLVDHLAAKLDLPVNPVGSRSVAKAMGFDNPYDVDKAGLRGAFQRRLVAEKRAWELENEAFVTDRTTFDNLTYTTMHGGTALLSEEDLAGYVEAMRRYTMVVYLPVHRFQNLGEDISRITNKAYHRVYDMVLRSLLREYRVLYIPLDCEVEHRKEILDRFIWG